MSLEYKLDEHPSQMGSCHVLTRYKVSFLGQSVSDNLDVA